MPISQRPCEWTMPPKQSTSCPLPDTPKSRPESWIWTARTRRMKQKRNSRGTSIPIAMIPIVMTRPPGLTLYSNPHHNPVVSNSAFLNLVVPSLDEDTEIQSSEEGNQSIASKTRLQLARQRAITIAVQTETDANDPPDIPIHK